MEDSSLLTLDNLLSNSLSLIDINIPISVQKKLIDYVFLLHKWNKTYNLTGIDEPRKMLIYHVIDSLVVTPYIVGRCILDFGTGAGLPGIPLALALPDCSWTLLDSNRKKTTFLTHLIGKLKINNVSVVHSRVEDFKQDECFDTIITRATSSLNCIIDKTKHLFCEHGQLLSMKGRFPKKEIDEVKAFVKVYELNVPYLDAHRHLVCIKGIH